MTYAAYKKLMRNSTLEGNEGPGVTVGSKHLPPSVVKVAIKIPESLNDQQRQILENILWINYQQFLGVLNRPDSNLKLKL